MSKGGGGGGSTTTVQKADPWIGLQPGLNALYSGAVNNFNKGGPQYYPLDTNAPSNWNIEQSLNMGQQRALGGSDVLRSGQNANTQTANGSMLGSNPGNGLYDLLSRGVLQGSDPAHGYLQSEVNGDYLRNSNPHLGAQYKAATRGMTEQFMNSIAPSIASQFSMAGRMGSGSHEAAIGQAASALSHGLGDMGANMYGQAYESERGRQQQAAQSMNATDLAQRQFQLQGAQGLSSNRNYERGLQMQAIGNAPGLANADYNDIEKLMGMGQFQQSQAQVGIDANRARYDYYQQLPFQNLQNLNQILQGGMSLNGSTSSGKNSQNRNPFAGALGGAASLYGLGSVMGGPAGAMLGGPVGMLGGALLGGLFG